MSRISWSYCFLLCHVLLVQLSAFSLHKCNLSCGQRHQQSVTSLLDSNAIDVEFTRSDDDDADEILPKTNSARPSRLESPLEASLNMVEPHLRIPIEFTDPITNNFIPCNLAFILDHEGVEYSIGTPVHTQVAIYCENDNGGSYFVDPDLDENLELMEMAAARFESLNQVKLLFQRTPRALTVQGDIDELTANWKDMENNLKPQDVVDIFDDSEEDEFFDTFFKKELGNDYEEKCLVENAEMDQRAQEMMDFFNVPGVGTEKAGIEELLDEIESDKETYKHDTTTNTETALRLVGFEGPDGKPYSLVKMLQPMVLVAKNRDDLAPDQRLLLTKEEADDIIPILEREFQSELSEAGLNVSPIYE